MDIDERKPKRRKTAKNGDLIQIGNKTISLSAFMGVGLTKKPATTAVDVNKAAQSAEGPTTTPMRDDSVEPPISTPATEDQAVPSSVADPSLKAKKAEKNGKPSSKSHGASHRHARPSSKCPPALLQARKALPIWTHQSEIKESLKSNNVLLMVGETGSGKSTQTPQFLCEEGWCQRQKVQIEGTDETVNVGGMVAITQPRRVAATTLANRVAREMGTPLGAGHGEGSVGYSVRFDHNIPKGAKIKFLTEGMLLQELLRDPNLRQYSVVIVDEIHERSVDVDLIAGFLKQILSSDFAGRGGVPLKVVIMSATADVETIQNFFQLEGSTVPSSKLLRIKGRQYPVEISHTDRPVPDIQEALVKQIFKIHTQEPLPGDILAFFIGQEEIETAQKLIEEYSATLAADVPKLAVYPLYGQLSIQAQQDAFLPAKKKFTRKVVLATNIAETSVTVPGVRYVVDCGKSKVKQFRPRLGIESLLAKPISKSSAIQRTGRAGREGPGKCFRLYTTDGYANLQDADLPEILRNDVLGAILTMKARGINDVLNFPLMDLPDLESIEKALLQLHFLGALTDDGKITEIGRKLSLFPVSASYGRVLLAAAEPEYDCLLEVIDIIACLTAGESIFLQVHSEEAKEEVEELRKELSRREGDLLTYLTTMQLYCAENADRVEWCKKRMLNGRNMKQALNIRKQLRGMCQKEKLFREAPPQDPQPFVPMSPGRAETLLKCFLRGFVTKSALLAPDSSYVTIQGKHVVAIHPSSVLHSQKKEAIMFLEHVYTTKNYAKKVSAIQADWILEAMTNKSPGQD